MVEQQSSLTQLHNRVLGCAEALCPSTTTLPGRCQRRQGPFTASQQEVLRLLGLAREPCNLSWGKETSPGWEPWVTNSPPPPGSGLPSAVTTGQAARYQRRTSTAKSRTVKGRRATSQHHQVPKVLRPKLFFSLFSQRKGWMRLGARETVMLGGRWSVQPPQCPSDLASALGSEWGSEHQPREGASGQPVPSCC